MPNFLASLNSRQIACDVEDELRFHLEMLELKYAQHGISAAEAKAAALRRFGNVEKFKRQCVQIRRRSSLLQRFLKTLLTTLVPLGLAIHLLSSERNVTRIGHILIIIAIFGRLLLYVRGLTPRNPQCS